MNFGETLKTAREAKKLTTSQVAAQTHMLTQIVEDMEREDFHRIAAPIYGRGFVRLYANCVGLDPAPLVKEFMDIYDGRRTPVVKTRPVPPPKVEPAQQIQTTTTAAPQPPAAPAIVPPPPPVVEPPAAAPVAEAASTTVPKEVKGLELFDADAKQQPAPIPVPPKMTAMPVAETCAQPVAMPAKEETIPATIVREKPAVPPPAVTSPAAPAAKDYSRFAAPLPKDDDFRADDGISPSDKFRSGLSSVSTGVLRSVRGIPRPIRRITLLIAILAAIIGLAAWGLVALFHVTMTTPAAALEHPAPRPAPIVLEPQPTPPPARTTQAAPAEPVRKPAPGVTRKPTSTTPREPSRSTTGRKSTSRKTR